MKIVKEYTFSDGERLSIEKRTSRTYFVKIERPTFVTNRIQFFVIKHIAKVKRVEALPLFYKWQDDKQRSII